MDNGRPKWNPTSANSASRASRPTTNWCNTFEFTQAKSPTSVRTARDASNSCPMYSSTQDYTLVRQQKQFIFYHFVYKVQSPWNMRCLVKTVLIDHQNCMSNQSLWAVIVLTIAISYLLYRRIPSSSVFFPNFKKSIANLNFSFKKIWSFLKKIREVWKHNIEKLEEMLTWKFCVCGKL